MQMLYPSGAPNLAHDLIIRLSATLEGANVNLSNQSVLRNDIGFRAGNNSAISSTLTGCSRFSRRQGSGLFPLHLVE
jgi:hypothetical protein